MVSSRTTILASLLAFSVCMAAPHDPLSKRAKIEDWPELFGEENRPTVEHLRVAWRHLNTLGADTQAEGSSSEVVDEYTADLLKRNAFWGVLTAITDIGTEGEWIKSLFELNDSVQNGEKSDFNILLHRPTEGDAKPEAETKKVSVKDSEKYRKGTPSEPMWPFALIEAVKSASWKPISDEEDVHALLQILTGEKTASTDLPGYDGERTFSTTEDSGYVGEYDTEAWWKAFETGNTAPMMYIWTASDGKGPYMDAVESVKEQGDYVSLIPIPFEGRRDLAQGVVGYLGDDRMLSTYNRTAEKVVTLADFDGFSAEE